LVEINSFKSPATSKRKWRNFDFVLTPPHHHHHITSTSFPHHLLLHAISSTSRPPTPHHLRNAQKSSEGVVVWIIGWCGCSVELVMEVMWRWCRDGVERR
jgi:hypothetical protein